MTTDDQPRPLTTQQPPVPVGRTLQYELGRRLHPAELIGGRTPVLAGVLGLDVDDGQVRLPGRKPQLKKGGIYGQGRPIREDAVYKARKPGKYYQLT